MSRLVVLGESAPGERRVAMVPADIGRVSGTGFDVHVEPGAGEAAGHPDTEYREAGADVGQGALPVDPGDTGSVVVVKVRPPTLDEVTRLPVGSTLVSFLPPAANLELVARLRDRNVTALSFDLVPRTSRAQSVDTLSSQAAAVGYQSAILAADRLDRIFPMLMTAAGTVPPAQVLVLGAGVAGLQAIATAKRLGASVSAYDVRPEAAEEVRSLGARFVELPLEGQSGSGGYAAEQSQDFLARQQELVAETVARSDVVITTAAVPGRPAPKLVTAGMVERMRPGAVIVDVASASGGNCVLTRDGETVEHRGVRIIGAGNLAAEVPATSSAMFSRNVANLLDLFVKDEPSEEGPMDEILAAMCVTSGGRVRHEATRAAMEGSAE